MKPSRRILLLSSLLLLCVGLISAVQANALPPTPPPENNLVYVPLTSTDDSTRFEGTGLPLYARLQGQKTPYLLVGAGPQGLQRLTQSGLSSRVLDADTQGASYYLAYTMPGRPQPDLGTCGQPLLDDGVQTLWRCSPQQAERLSQTGVELRALSLDPKPLSPAQTESSLPQQITPNPLVQAMIDQISSTLVYSYTGDLSGEWPVDIGGLPYTIATRHTASGVPVQNATRYAYDHLQDLGLDVQYHNWSSSGYSGRNVIAEITGQTDPDDIFILCAHIDDMPPGSLAPGADDNASGSVAVLMAADVLSQYQWGCTLRFALWTGEEQGLLGSEVYAQQAYNSGENIIGVLNLDMIAYNTLSSAPDIDLHANSSMPDTLVLAQLFADVVSAYNLGLIPQIIPNGTGASDHASFWQYGYTAILGIEDFGDFNPRYHTTGDLLQYLDIPYYTDFVKASLGTFVHMSDCGICLPVTGADFHWQPISPTISQTVAFSASYISGTQPVQLEWDLGDGHSETGSQIEHVYAAPGDYSVTLTATNPCGQNVVSHTLSVQPPSCTELSTIALSLVSSGSLYVDEPIELSLDLTPDDAAKPYTYTIDYGDGSPALPATSVQDPLTLSHTYTASGAYAVELYAWNCTMSVPLSDSIQLTVTTPCTPLAGIAILGETGGYPGVYTFSTQYTPPDATPPLSYSWDNGDTSDISQRALDLGPHHLIVTATNCLSPTAMVTASHAITIQAAPVCTPLAGLTLTQITTGIVHPDTPLNLSLDLAPDEAAKPYTYTLSYGDGNSMPATTSAQDPLPISHTYAASGTYTAQVTAWNCDMSVPLTAALPITVTAAASECLALISIDLSPISTGTLQVGNPVGLQLDLAPDEATKPYTYTISYGDGSLILPAASVQDPLLLSHTYAASGTYTAQVAAWNCDMSTPLTDSLQVRVTSPKITYAVYLPILFKNPTSL